jgi:CO/xanthine dehydrogenase FAD-binding subunit
LQGFHPVTTTEYACRVEVLAPRCLADALRLKAERPDAVPIHGGTDVMVDLNFDRFRPSALLNLNEVPELGGWARENGTIRLGAGLTYTEAMEPRLAEALPALAQAARTIGGPQIRNRGTLGGNLGTASPAGDSLPPLLVCEGEVEVASVRGERRLPLSEFCTGPRRNALADDELILAVRARAGAGPQTFMKVGPRNAMVISVVSLALRVDRERELVTAAFGSAGPVPGLVSAPLEQAAAFAEHVVEASSPIDDVRGSATYRRHALRVLTTRALERCLT